MAVDYYAALGVSPDASSEDIKRAFRRLARELHPDATGNDPHAAERYKEISEAYAVLSNPQKRREYDLARSGAWTGSSPFSSTIDDIFESFFGVRGTRPRQRTRARHGDSIEVTLEVPFREVVFGAERTLKFDRAEPCETCDGEGTAPGTYAERCPACEGSGQVQQVRRTILGSVMTATPCTRCGQTGWVVPNPCRTCGGDGRVSEEAEVKIEIPPGIDTGDRLRIRGEGESGAAGGGRGDLYVRFVVEPDERFARSGDDLVTWTDIPMTIAALGGDVVFTSLDGEERLSIPAGTQSGELFRIRGRGAVRRHGGRGDLHVRVNVLTPTDLDGDQERLLRDLAALRGEETKEGEGFLGRLRRALRMED